MLNTRVSVGTSWLRKKNFWQNGPEQVWTAAPVLDKNRVGFVENWKIILVFAQEK